MRYELERLGPDSFEHLIQSLIRGVFGNSAIIFGAGPDGQREAVIEDADHTIGNNIAVYGRIVVQAKFKGADTKAKDWDWLRANLEYELEGFKKKLTTHPKIVPDTFLFFTNIVLTPTLDSGTRDRAEKFVEGYKDVVPHMIIFGADDIRTMLDNNRDVARCYASFIMPGDVLAELHENLEEIKNEKFEDLVEYARQMFREDSAVRLEQAGSVSSRSINIRNVYTDLEVKGAEGEIDQIAAYIIELGNGVHKRESEDADVLGKGIRNHRKHPPKNNIVLIGNAGQGKSTLCQYICQIYRAALLRRFKKNEPETQDYFAEDSGQSPLVPRCERFPVLINLKRYAAWINKQEAENSRSVITYILSLINGRANAALSIYDFRRLLSGYSWIFLFDGLDEVPASSNRNEVLKQIQEFLEKDLAESSCDNLVICTSRPQGYDDAFSVSQYNHYELKDMSKSLCESYIEKLLTYLEDNIDERERYRRILDTALADPMVSKLMTTPLYTAIIVLLVKMGGTPPTKRYALFQEYCEIVIKRERQKEMLPAIHDEYDWIMKIHAQIGFLLQTESETAENAAAELSADRCKALIVRFLQDEGVEDELTTQAEELYQAITNRLLFLPEVSGSDSEACVMFPLRSIQEYFAAEWLISFDDEDKLSEALEMISVSGYWRNVYLFVAGFFAKNRSRKNMNEALFRICQRNNGDENHDSPDAEAYRIAMQGSWLALDLLCDNLFSRPEDQRRYLNIAAKLLDWNYNIPSLSQRFLRLPSRVADIFLQEKVIPYIQEAKSAEGAAFNYLWAMSNSGNEKAYTFLEDIIDKVPVPGSYTIRGCLTNGFSEIGDKAICTVYRWITEDRFADFGYPYSDREYWGFLSAFFTHSQSVEFSQPALRQIVYRLLYGMRLDWSIIGKESVFHSHPLLRRLIENDGLRELAYFCHAGTPDLMYKPIQRDLKKLPLLEYAESFRSCQLEELAALMEFLHAPSYLGLKSLLEVYGDLPDSYKEPFSRVMAQYNWLLHEIVDRLNDDPKDIDSLLAHYNNAYVEACLEKDHRMTGLVEAEDLVSITTSHYWNEIHLAYGETVPSALIREILGSVDETHIDTGFLSFLGRATEEKSITPELIHFGMSYYPLLFQTSESMGLALRLFCEMPLEDLLSGKIEYPKMFQPPWVYYPIQENEVAECLKKVDRLAELDQKSLQVYALLPCAFSSIKREFLPKLPPDMLMGYYDTIRGMGNEEALLGCVLRLLTGPVPEERKSAIWEELLRLLSIASIESVWYSSVDLFDMEGKLLVYKSVNSLVTRIEWGDELLARYAGAILEEVETSPIDRDELMKLSDVAHSN